MASDIDSEAETVSTDILLQSFYKMGMNNLEKGKVHINDIPWFKLINVQISRCFSQNKENCTSIFKAMCKNLLTNRWMNFHKLFIFYYNFFK